MRLWEKRLVYHVLEYQLVILIKKNTTKITKAIMCQTAPVAPHYPMIGLEKSSGHFI
eukprot:SAG11_NODE_5737_length_1471_cov_1.768000_1_plen_57_part_00